MAQPVWKTVWEFLKKLNINVLYSPTVQLLGFYPIEMQPCVWVFVARIFIMTESR